MPLKGRCACGGGALAGLQRPASPPTFNCWYATQTPPLPAPLPYPQPTPICDGCFAAPQPAAHNRRCRSPLFGNGCRLLAPLNRPVHSTPAAADGPAHRAAAHPQAAAERPAVCVGHQCQVPVLPGPVRPMGLRVSACLQGCACAVPAAVAALPTSHGWLRHGTLFRR